MSFVGYPLKVRQFGLNDIGDHLGTHTSNRASYRATALWRLLKTFIDDASTIVVRRDGREHYYIEDAETLKAMAIDSLARFKVGNSRWLFRASFASTSLFLGPTYAPSPDGQRLVVVEDIDHDGVHPRATINWTPGR